MGEGSAALTGGIIGRARISGLVYWSCLIYWFELLVSGFGILGCGEIVRGIFPHTCFVRNIAQNGAGKSAGKFCNQ